MNSRQILRLILIVLVAALAATAPASAQKRGRAKQAPAKKRNAPPSRNPEPEADYEDPASMPEPHEELSPLARMFLSELTGAGLDYWTARLNTYKGRIDRTLNECDLAELNRIRVFWSMFVDNKGWVELGMTGERIFDGNNGEENPTAGSEDDEIEKGIDRLSEIAETIFAARSIARRYRPELASMRNEMAADLDGFVDTIITVKNAFNAAHRAEIEADPQMREQFEKVDRATIEQITGELKQEKKVGLIANIILEPVVMLYNGQDLRRLFKELDVLPAELEGLAIADNAVLAQSRPNPAAGTVTIGYTLGEPSSRTMLRLFNARGELVGTYDQGTRAAGAHDATIDVGQLPSGAYLYHLTVVTSQGERVYSRTMQVTH